MALEGFAGHVPSWVPGKAVPGEMTCQRHSAAKLHNLLLEKLQLLQETGAGEAVLVGVGLGEAKPTAAKGACRDQNRILPPCRVFTVLS